jgi:hypothetical protein
MMNRIVDRLWHLLYDWEWAKVQKDMDGNIIHDIWENFRPQIIVSDIISGESIITISSGVRSELKTLSER